MLRKWKDRRAKKKDKREIILKALYDNNATAVTAMYNIKPLMLEWSNEELYHTLDQLMHPVKLIHLFPGPGEPYSPFGLDSKTNGVPKVTIDSYKAEAWLTREGEEHYRLVYQDAAWNRLNPKVAIVSAIISLVLSTWLAIDGNQTKSALEDTNGIVKRVELELKALQINYQHLLRENSQLREQIKESRKKEPDDVNSSKTPSAIKN
jgi:hypothetical protein